MRNVLVISVILLVLHGVVEGGSQTYEEFFHNFKATPILGDRMVDIFNVKCRAGFVRIRGKCRQILK
ncbi:hypothetical protein JTB14_026807 [Gonioctena quinquepunctata]|nr:hypothetical protein JTB14_026807 [Gonioctena quinquepunctata]